MIDHCISTHNAVMRERIYHVYISDLLKGIAQNAAGLRVDKRYYDLAFQQKVVEETRTPEEIIDTISTKLKKLGEGEK